MGRAERRILAGLVMIPAFLLQPNLGILALQTLLLILLAAFFGRKIKLILLLAVSLSIILMNTLQENGRVLAAVGNFHITLGALGVGARKALTLAGMIYLSQFMVSGRPRFPGFFGELLTRQFFYFEHLVSVWRRPAAESLNSGYREHTSRRRRFLSAGAGVRFVALLDTMLEEMERYNPVGMESEGEEFLSGRDSDLGRAASGSTGIRVTERGEIALVSTVVLIVWGTSIIGFSGILPW